MIHIVMGQSAGGSARLAFEKLGHRLIVFPISFAIGPLKKLNEPEGIDAHFEWLQKAFCVSDNEVAEWKGQFIAALQAVRDIKANEKVLIWTCESASEQAGLRYVLSQIPTCELSIANTQQGIDELNKHRDIRRQLRNSGEVVSESFAAIYEGKLYERLTESQRNASIVEARRLLQSEATLRSWIHGVLLDERETRDDELILSCAKELHLEMDEPFLPAARVIGHVYGHSEQDVPVSWLEYRLRALIAQGVFYYEGDLKAMRLYKVKLNDMHELNEL